MLVLVSCNKDICVVTVETGFGQLQGLGMAMLRSKCLFELLFDDSTHLLSAVLKS